MHSASWRKTVSSSMIHCIFVMAVTVPALAGPAGDTPVSSLDPNDLIGRSLDELPSEFQGDYELPLKAGLGMTVKTRDSRHFVLLFARKKSKSISKRIVSVLEIPEYDEKVESLAFNFDCDSPGGEVRRGDPVVALFAIAGRGYAPTRLGWKVNVLSKTFEPVAGIRCYSFE